MVNKLVAGILSLIIPGLGQMVQGFRYKGGVLLLIAIIIAVLSYLMGPWGIYFIWAYIIYAIIVAIDAYLTEPIIYY
ncbi:MAG: hypothetical protein HUK28_01915 [Methanobrevibacter sp.]|nr:hypothetical protein [Methanobrevibacter sp.]